MKKYIKRLLLLGIIMLLFIPFSVVFADVEPATSNSCNNEESEATIKEYQQIHTDLVKNGCLYNQAIKSVSAEGSESYGSDVCISLHLKLVAIVTKMESMVKENEDCRKYFGEYIKVIDCSGNDVVNDIKNYVMRNIFIIAPFLLIIFVGIDLLRIVTMSDEGAVKKVKTNIFKRTIAFVLLYLVPVIVNIFITNFESLYPLRGDILTCKEDEIDFLTFDTVNSTSFNDITREIHSTARTIKSAIEGRTDGIGSIYNGVINNVSQSYAAERILTTAKSLMETYKNESRYYSLKGGMGIGNIKDTTLNRKATCCATFVASVMYLSGLIPEEVINKYLYNYANGSDSVEGMLDDAGWIRIYNYDDMQPGDVAFTINPSNGRIGHTQIYAGNDQWYNAGGQKTLYGISKSNDRSTFHHASRYPGIRNVSGIDTGTNNTGNNSTGDSTGDNDDSKKNDYIQ